MIWASDGASPPAAAGEKAADACGVAAISMPRSSAAVLTLVLTRLCPGSCAVCGSGESAEVPVGEGDSGSREGFDSGAMQRKKDPRHSPGPSPLLPHSG